MSEAFGAVWLKRLVLLALEIGGFAVGGAGIAIADESERLVELELKRAVVRKQKSPRRCVVLDQAVHWGNE